MNTSSAITGIALANRPPQLDLLMSFATVLQASAAVSDILVRGSFAAGKADRSSDVDLVIGISESEFQSFRASLDALIAVELGAIFSGWRDTLVRDMGGAGYVYLVPLSGVLCELDLYVVPEREVPAILARGVTAIYRRTAAAQTATASCAEPPAVPICGEDNRARDLVVEILVLFHMIGKRVGRRQSFIVYGQTYMLHDAIRGLIKHCLAPWSRHWGWYHLEEDLGSAPPGSGCLRELQTLVSGPPIRDRETLEEVFTRVRRVIAAAAPATLAELGPELEAYCHYMGFPK
jgi:hypothetical protein